MLVIGLPLHMFFVFLDEGAFYFFVVVFRIKLRVLLSSCGPGPFSGDESDMPEAAMLVKVFLPFSFSIFKVVCSGSFSYVYILTTV